MRGQFNWEWSPKKTNGEKFVEGIQSRQGVSGAANISGTNQFQKSPIINGIIMKKITKAWAVTMTV